MSLYYEAADILGAPNNAGGSLKSRIFSKKDFKSPAAQIYALVIETCKWSFVLKEVIEKTGLLRLERKLTPVLALLLTHDLLLAKRGISLPATHGLRASIERHKARLTSEFTRARIRRQLGTLAAFTEHVEAGLDNAAPAIPQHPRWIRINTLRTTLDEQLATTFAGWERAASVEEVQRRGARRVFLDEHIPDLLAIPPNVDLTKDRAYTSGALVFQDKASCFPAYLLDPLPQDGDVIDSCAAPGNKTTHLASIVAGHSGDFDVADPESVRRLGQRIHAFEKDKFRAKTLEKMVGLAGSDVFTTIHGNCDFLKADPNSAEFAKVGALLLDPSCSGSGIVGRDDMPELHLPDADAKADVPGQKGRGKPKSKTKEKEKAEKAAEKARAAKEKESLKRKRDEDDDEDVEVIVDDDGIPTAITSAKDLETRLAALSAFQLSLLLHAMSFPAAQKITYSTCSIHVEENESVVLQALDSTVARERGWRVLRRDEQVRGMREWPVRGDGAWCAEKCGERAEEVGEACIRANKWDGRGTMGFFVCGFVRDGRAEMEGVEVEKRVLRDAGGRIVRDAMGVPVLAFSEVPKQKEDVAMEEEEEEWGGFGDDEASGDAVKDGEAETPSVVEVKAKEEGSSTPAKKKRRKAKKKAD